MSPENTKKLFEKFPKIFSGKDEPLTQNLMGFGFECGDGWYNLIDALCGSLQWDTDKNNYNGRYPQIKAVQVKEKYGSLRFYTAGATDYQQGMVDFAETMSETTCELCGQPGKVYDEGWVYTRCEKCAKEQGLV